jgi:hypothetical protein
MTRTVLSTLALLAAVMLGLYPAGAARASDPCDLLRDPTTRAQLSGSFERKLMIKCGLISPAEIERARRAPTSVGRTAPPVAPDPSGIPPEEEELAADVRVNNPVGDPLPHTTQSETSIAVNGATVCAGFNDSGAFAATGNFTGFAFSTNGGATWTDGGPLPTGTGSDNNFGDPSIVYSTRDGAFYFATLSDLGLSMWKSTSCTSWTYVGAIHVGGGDDKEIMAVDNNPASPFFGRLYVAWIDFNFPTSTRFRVTFSNNGGATWSAPVSLPATSSGQGAWPAVAPNGDLFVALMFQSFAPGALQTQAIYRSTDGGLSFLRRTDFATAQLRPENAASTSTCGRQALNGNIRNLSSPQIAIHRDVAAPAGYVIHAVWPYDSDGAGGLDRSNVFYRRSTDGAATWSVEKKLNDDGTTRDQWFPAIGVNSNGVVVASWYDRRLDVNNFNFDRFAVESTDGGLTFGANTRISDVSSGVPTLAPNFDTFIATCYHGDYDQIAVDGTTAYLLWSDDRRLEGTRPDPDIYFDTIVFGGGGGSETGLCKGITNFSFATVDAPPAISTTSAAFVDMPGMSVTFTIAGTARRNCVKVEFSAYTFAANAPVAGQLLMVRALLDGATVGSPGEVQFSGDDDEDADGSWARSHAFNFEFKDIAAGPHTIKIQWRSFFGGTVFAHSRSVFVHHK